MITKSQETAELIGRLYNNTLSYEQIANRLELNYLTVRQTINVMAAGFVSLVIYQNYLAKQRGFSCMSDYQTYLAKQRGFSSISEYKEIMRSQSQQKPENIALCALINTRLEEKRKSHYWLSKQIGVSRQAVSFYSSGKIIPNKHILARLFRALGVSYKRLEEIVD